MLIKSMWDFPKGKKIVMKHFLRENAVLSEDLKA